MPSLSALVALASDSRLSSAARAEATTASVVRLSVWAAKAAWAAADRVTLTLEPLVLAAAVSVCALVVAVFAEVVAVEVAA